MLPQRHEWTAAEMVAGAPCLEFANTVGDLSKTRDVERLTDWEALLQWGELAGILGAGESVALRKAGGRDPSGAQRTVLSLRRFREVFFRTASALAANRAPAQYDLDQLETTIQGAIRSAHLVRQGAGFDWSIGPMDTPFHLPLFRIALSALALLQGGELAFLRECQRCSWLFIDRSRSHGRRWCRADACGNRARVARHYKARVTRT